MKTLKVGTKVRWLSQSGFCLSEKRGAIICIVPSGERPFVIKANNQKVYTLPDGRTIPIGRTRYGGGLPRNEVSYIVCVPNPKNPQAAESYYWPRVGHMKIEDE